MEVCQSNEEIINLKELVKKSNELKGDLIEIGVYMGGSSNIIENNKLSEKKLYLVDTFEGLLDVDLEKDNPNETNLKNGQFKYSEMDYLKNYFSEKNVEVIKSYFPENLPENLNNTKFCFVHLDVDTYLSTLNSLDFLYGRIVSGGIIVIHDYVNKSAEGVKKAVDEFLLDKEEIISNIVGSQCTIIKL